MATKPLKLFEEAKKAQKKAYAPYSKFKVGAALRSKGKIFTGFNIENASYGAVVCAERVAVWKAVSEGNRQFDEILIVTNSKKAAPCGLCLQVLTEFCKPSLKIWIATQDEILESFRLKDCLPKPFGPRELKQAR